MSSSIWHRTPTCAEIDALHESTTCANIGMEMVEVGDNYLVGRIPVDHRTVQPFGRLHGGAAVLLLESLASVGSVYAVDEDHTGVGLEINCNHLRAARDGWVTGRATALHLGRTTHVWQLEAFDDQGKQTTVGRITVAVIPIKR